jgi:hypothetical protein
MFELDLETVAPAVSWRLGDGAGNGDCGLW